MRCWRSETTTYKPLIDFGGWRVAILRYMDELQPDGVDRVKPQPMVPGALYKVIYQVWHTNYLGRAADVLIVENQDTGDHNTEFCDLDADQQSELLGIGRREGFI